MLPRRDLLQATARMALLPLAGCPRQQVDDNLGNDVHSQLDPTRVDSIL